MPLSITCNRASLSAAFQTVASAVPTGGNKPILNNVLVEANGETTLIANNLELSITAKTDADIKSKGRVLIPAALGAQILQQASGDALTILESKTRIEISDGTNRWTLGTGNADEFPMPSQSDTEWQFAIKASTLRQLFHRTIFAANAGTAYSTAGVLLEFEGSRCTGVTTDGRRLAIDVIECAVLKSQQRHSQIIVPQRAAQVLEKVLRDIDGDVQIRADENSIVFSAGATVIDARLLAGRFPRWTDFVPKRGDRLVTLPVGAFTRAIQQASVTAEKESRAIDMSIANGCLTISATDVVGESKIVLPIDSDREANVRLDYRYLLQFLSVLNAGDSVEMYFTDSDSALVFAHGDYQAVIMPMMSERNRT